ALEAQARTREQHGRLIHEVLRALDEHARSVALEAHVRQERHVPIDVPRRTRDDPQDRHRQRALASASTNVLVAMRSAKRTSSPAAIAITTLATRSDTPTGRASRVVNADPLSPRTSSTTGCGRAAAAADRVLGVRGMGTTMAWLGHLNANFKIGTRIGAGFFLILGLLLTVATGGYLGLRNSLTGFEAYERTARNSTLVAEADRNFLAMRLNVQMFLQAADDKLVARVRELGKLATDAYKEVDANSVTRERREMVEQVIGQLDQYLQNFEKVAKNQVIIDHEINETTIPLANKLRDSIKGLAQMVANGEDDVTALEASKAMENLLSARVNALLNNQKRAPKLVEMARGQLAALGTSLKLMRQIATQPARQEKAQAAVDALPPYVAAFEKVQTLIGERDKLLELETKIGTEMIATRAKLKAAQEHSLTEKMTATAAAISSSSTLCLSVAGAALALGLALAWFISRGITRPILSLKSAMDAISHGKLDLEVDGAGRKDEIGEMAEAVLVFRDAGREKARLEAAAEKHRETAKNERM